MDERKEILLNLKKRRESLGISLDELHNKTKIRAQILKQIDNCDLTGIDNVYAISFIKSIGSVLKLENDEINDIILNLGLKSASSKKDYSANVYVQNVDFSKSVFKNEKSRLPNIKSFLDVKYLNYLIYGSLFILIILVIYFSFFHSSVSTSDNIPNRVIDTLEIKGGASTANVNIPDSVVLEARGIDTAWLRLVIDGKNSEQIVMLPKMERQWIAKKFIQLSVGNGGAIEFKRNGKVLEPFGAKGSVVRNVKITPTEIVVSSAPWSAPKDTVYQPKKPTATPKKKDKKKDKQQVDNQPRRLESSGVQEQFKPFKR